MKLIEKLLKIDDISSKLEVGDGAALSDKS